VNFSYLTESPGHGFEAASPQILQGEGLPRFFPSPDPTHVGASGTGSALCHVSMKNLYFEIQRKKPIRVEMRDILFLHTELVSSDSDVTNNFYETPIYMI